MPPGEVAWAAAFISRLGVFRHIFFPSGRRVISLTTEWVASEDAPNTEAGTFDGAVDGHGIDKILGARGKIAASAERSGDEVERRRNDHLIKSDEKYEDRFHLSFAFPVG